MVRALYARGVGSRVRGLNMRVCQELLIGEGVGGVELGGYVCVCHKCTMGPGKMERV